MILVCLFVVVVEYGDLGGVVEVKVCIMLLIEICGFFFVKVFELVEFFVENLYRMFVYVGY